MSRVFLSNLKQGALEWFQQLSSGTISSFSILTKQFFNNYYIHIQENQGIDSLFKIAKGHNESLKDYVDRFESALVRVESSDQHLLLTMVRRGFWEASSYQ